jgi:hypothetical protein
VLKWAGLASQLKEHLLAAFSRNLNPIGASISEFIRSDIPARLDRLPWSRWHLRVIAALAITWLLDGLEGSLGGGTYVLWGLALLASSWLFLHSRLGVYSQVAWWAAMFFFASCAASSAYLTVSKVFPQDVRASSIAFFYSFGTLAGGALGPLIFGHLIGGESRIPLYWGYVSGAAVMILAGLAQAVWGVPSECKPLEALAINS